jgi:hypothetical protein
LLAASKRKFTATVLLPAAFILFMSGCTDNKQLKQDLLQAVSKQQEIKTYKFNGSIELKADTSLFGQASPITSALFALIKDSKIDYKGISSLEPSRMESELKVTPAGASPIDIPVLIKDSKLYFHIPAINKDEEFMVLPVQAAKSPAPASGSGEPLQNTGRLTAAFDQQLLNEIDPNWLQTAKDPVILADGTTAKRITLDVNPKNEKTFSDYWDKLQPGFIELLKTNSLASGASLETWQAALKQIKIKAPTTVDMLIDNQGFIHEQKWNLSFTSGGSANINHMVWTQSLTEINQNPAFAQEIPAKTKSLDELLKLTQPAAAVKK